MKRLTALAMTLMLLLSLAACGSGESAPSIQDKLDHTPTASQSSDAPDAPAEPESESQPEIQSGQRQPSVSKENSEPSEGAPVPAGLSRFVGIYTDDLARAEEWTVLEIRVCGDILLLEYTNWVENDVTGVWAMEFWPDLDNAGGGESEVLTGMCQCLSSYEGPPEYTAAATACSIARLEDGVSIQSMGESAEYRCDASLPTVHASLSSHMALLSGQPDAELAGDWECGDGTRAAWLHLGADGVFSYICKAQYRPIEVLEGAWVLDRESDCLTVQAERIGSDPAASYELTLSYFAEDGGLFLLDTAGYSDLSLYDGLFFWPAEGQWSTGFPMSQLTGVYYEARNLSGTVADAGGYEACYSYRVPYFLPNGSSALEEINTDIYDRFDRLLQNQLSYLASSEQPPVYLVDYSFAVYDGLEQLMVWTDSYYELPDCAVYCYDRAQDIRLDTKDLLDRLGISEDAFLEAVRDAAAAYFQAVNSSMTEEQWQDMGCDEALAWTVSDEAVNLRLPVLVDSFGELAVVARIGSTGETAYYHAILYPFSDSVG